MEACATRRDVTVLQPEAVMALDRSGALPTLPSDVLGFNRHEIIERQPTSEEYGAYVWLQTLGGILAMRRTFDAATSTDAIEIVHVAGTKRAIVTLLRYVFDMGEKLGFLVLGGVDIQNTTMIQLLARRFGCRMERVVMVRA